MTYVFMWFVLNQSVLGTLKYETDVFAEKVLYVLAEFK